MRLPDTVRTVRMERVAVVSTADGLRAALVRVADAGVLQVDRVDDGAGGSEAARRLRHLPGAGSPAALAAEPPDLDALERAGRADLLAGEAELAAVAAGAVHRGAVAGLAGWCPTSDLPALAERLAPIGAAVVPMATPRGVDPPTRLVEGRSVRRAFAPLVNVYGTVPYADVDPTIPAGVAYVVMFGMMFGDAGHGLLLLAIAVLLRLGRPRRLARLRAAWPFVAGAGLAATAFGVLYGEFFGPTGVLPVVWLSPLEEPLRLLLVAVAVGAVLLGVAYGVGIVNRWREGGVTTALYASSGIAGSLVFLGLGGVVAGLLLDNRPTTVVGLGGVLGGLGLAAVGLFAESTGGATGVVQAVVGLFDLLVRLGSNLVSFARLAAFGMTHAALGWVVWEGASSLAAGGGWGLALGVLAFVVGNALAFALEAVVAAVQALRLEFYELFSRVFVTEGTPFRPWHVPTSTLEVVR